MQITAVIPESYQEYYDHLAIVLFTFGCNLHCKFCYNYDYVSNPLNILQKSVEEIIDEHINPLIDGLVFLGGEPTLDPRGLEQAARYAKRKHNLHIKLFTNGTNASIVLKGLQEGWLDYVSVDFKTIYDDDLFLKSNNPLGKVRFLLDTLHLEGRGNKVEVRTTIYDGMAAGDLEEIKFYCQSLGFKHIIQQELDYVRIS